MDMSVSKLKEMVKDREAWPATIHGVTKSRTQLNNCKQRQRQGGDERAMLHQSLSTATPSPHTLGSLALQQPCIWARVSSENSTIKHFPSPPDRIRIKKREREETRLVWFGSIRTELPSLAVQPGGGDGRLAEGARGDSHRAEDPVPESYTQKLPSQAGDHETDWEASPSNPALIHPVFRHNSALAPAVWFKKKKRNGRKPRQGKI